MADVAKEGKAVEMADVSEPKAKRRKPKTNAPADDGDNKGENASPPPKKAKPTKKAAPASVEKEEEEPLNRVSVDSVRFGDESAERAAALERFKEFDKDGSGSIDANELASLCRKVGRPLTKKELNDAMLILDKDKNGSIDFNEFYNWFSNHLTATATPRHMMLADVRRKMRKYTPSNAILDTMGPALGVVVPTDFSFGRLMDESSHAWARMTAGTFLESSKKKKVREIFKKYDEDNSGELDLDEFGHFCRDLGRNFTQQELEQALHEIDDDGNGTVDFEEFYKWWCSDPENEEHADFTNRFKNLVLGYRDTSAMDAAKSKATEVNSKAGATGDPGLIAENRRLKDQIAQMQAQLDALAAGQAAAVKPAENKKAVPASDDDEASFEEIKTTKTGDAKAAESSEEEEEPVKEQRKKKGKRKSRKPQKLEDSEDYETSEDESGKIKPKGSATAGPPSNKK